MWMNQFATESFMKRTNDDQNGIAIFKSMECIKSRKTLLNLETYMIPGDTYYLINEENHLKCRRLSRHI